MASACRPARPRCGSKKPGRDWKRTTSHAFALATIALCSLTTGCVHLPLFQSQQTLKPGELPVHLVATFDNKVQRLPDPVRSGAMTPCLAGRLLFFTGSVGYPVAVDGSVTVQMFCNVGTPQGIERKLLEQWNFDNEGLKKLYSKDMIGWGYSLLLPWSSYHPAITEAEMVVTYYSPSGDMRIANAPLRLDPQERPLISTRSVQPAMPPANPAR